MEERNLWQKLKMVLEAFSVEKATCKQEVQGAPVPVVWNAKQYFLILTGDTIGS